MQETSYSGCHICTGKRAAWRFCLSSIAVVMMAALVSGCVSFGLGRGQHSLTGERVAYHVFNRTGALQIMMPELFDANTGSLLYANLYVNHPSQDSGRSGSWIWSESANATPDEALREAAFGPFGQRLLRRPIPLTALSGAPASERLMLPRPAAGAFKSAPDSHRIPSAVLLSWRAPALPGQKRFKGSLQGPVRLALRAAIPADVLELLTQSSGHTLEVAIGASSSRPVVVWRLTNTIDNDVEVLARGSVDAVRLTSPRNRQ